LVIVRRLAVAAFLHHRAPRSPSLPSPGVSITLRAVKATFFLAAASSFLAAAAVTAYAKSGFA
jgi:hypothetical protein